MSYADPITRASHSRLTEALRENSEFGATFSDHMLVAIGKQAPGSSPRSFPSPNLLFSCFDFRSTTARPSSKASKPTAPPAAAWPSFVRANNFARLNRSARALAMPEIPESLFLGGVAELVRLDREWPPSRGWRSLHSPTYSASTTLFSFRPQPFPPHRHDLSRWSLFLATDSSFSPKSASSAPPWGQPVTAKPPQLRRWPPRPRESPRKKGFITSSG